MATVMLLICVLAAATAGGAEPWDLSEGTWECAGVDDSAEEIADWPSGLEGLWLSQGCEPPQEWGGAWSLRSLLLEPLPPGAGSGAGGRARATLLRHVYADEWCARPLYSIAAVATLLHGEEREGGWSVRMEGASGCGHSWEGARRVLELCCACAHGSGRHVRPHRQLSLFSRAPPQRAHAGQRDNDASRRHAGPAPPVSEAAAANCLSRLWSELPVQQLAAARVHTAPHRLGPRRTLLLPDTGGRSQPPLLHAKQRRGCAACWAVLRGSLTSPPQLAARPRLPASAAAAPTAPASWAAPGSCHPPRPALSLHFDATAAAWQLQLEVRCAPAGPSWRAAASGGFWAEGAALRLRRARLAVEGAAWAAGCPPEPSLALLDVDSEGDPALLVWAAGCAPAAPRLLPPLRLRVCRPRAAAHVAAAAPAVAAPLMPLAVAALRFAGLPWR